VTIRPASPVEGRLLREIEITSKGHWGYPDELMKRFAKLISMDQDYIRKHEVWVIENADEIAGFYGLIHGGEVCELDHLWLLPRYIGKGLGRQLFEHALQRAQVAGALRMEWQAEPNAVGFYERMGAYRVRTETGLLGTPIDVLGIELEA
jgi:GNAT superfamily N-acetyltransferase